MKKIFFTIILAALFSQCIFSYIGKPKYDICTKEDEFEIIVKVAPDTKVLARNEVFGYTEIPSIYTLEFENSRKQTAQMRFSMFKDFYPEEVVSMEKALTHISDYTTSWFFIAFGFIPKKSDFIQYDYTKLKEDFNAHYGWYLPIDISKTKIKQAYTKGFDKCFVQVFFRRGQGFVIRTTLYSKNFKFSKDGTDYFHNLKNFEFISD